MMARVRYIFLMNLFYSLFFSAYSLPQKASVINPKQELIKIGVNLSIKAILMLEWLNRENVK